MYRNIIAILAALVSCSALISCAPDTSKQSKDQSSKEGEGFSSRGGLSWKYQELELEAKATDSSLLFSFPLKNTSNKAVNILKIKTSCGCTAPQKVRQHFKPGEEGTVDVVFKFENRSGPQKKKVVVITDGKEDSLVELTLKTNIPKLVSIKPSFTVWKEGEPPSDKIVVVTFNHEKPIKLTEVEPGNNFFEVELLEKIPGKKYFLKVKPKTTSGSFYADVKLHTDFPEESPRSYRTTLRVTGKTGERLIQNPPWIKLNPNGLNFMTDEKDESQAKTVLLESTADAPINIKSLDIDRKKWEVSYETVEKGKLYMIKLKPKSYEKTFRDHLVIKTDYPKEAPQHVKIPCQVRERWLNKKDKQETVKK